MIDADRLKHGFTAFIERLLEEAEAKGRLSIIFWTVHQAIVSNEKQDIIDVLQILLNVMMEYRHLAQSEEDFWAVVQHIRDVKQAVEAESQLERRIAWKRIEDWRRAGYPSFILDFGTLRQIANLD